MNTKRYLTSGIVLLLAAASLPLAATAQAMAAPEAPPRAARAPEDKEQLERRLVSVATLIESSSAAKQIDASGIAQAQAERARARELRLQAEQSYKAGNVANASRQLDEAAKALFEGVRLAAPEQVTGEKRQRDFDNRLESVKALLSAQKRISAEKKLGAKGTETSNKIEAQIREAQSLAAAGKLDQGRAVLDQVYVMTKAAIENMRDGDTLVRSLHFASKEEEYHYEVDRNDTHKMLVKVLLEEKRANNPGLEGMVQKYLEQAATLRASADGLAAKKDYEGAIKTLEDSTKELVRAIRSAGVYIPG
ncbi:MAG TPA: hypothetical protein DHV59_08765 [Oxalobacteraceae bacterium]|nr:hypothetical protein [Oxalobacteraceae bacterium]